jgi:glycosyltransferase involved in cell wall biosynthesis
MINLSVVVPCFNEEEVLPETITRLSRVLDALRAAGKISGASRIYFVDDGSRDATWRLIEEGVNAGKPIVGVKLSRNRGHQNALLAGLFSAQGDALISVDADLQDDLGAIEKMIDAHLLGADVVYGVRRRRDTDTWFKRFTAESFYRLIAFMGAQTIFNHADYRLMSRRAVEALKDYREVNLFLRGIVPLIGFRSAVVEYDRAPRFAGESKYPLKKMLALSAEAITSFSVYPLRLISLMGFCVSAGSIFVTLWALWVAFYSGRTVPGWASTVLPIYFLGGVQLLALGVIGEYVGKIYMEAKGRPRFLVERIHGESHGEARITAAGAGMLSIRAVEKTPLVAS